MAALTDTSITNMPSNTNNVTAENDELPDYYVGVKKSYLISRSNNAVSFSNKNKKAPSTSMGDNSTAPTAENVTSADTCNATTEVKVENNHTTNDGVIKNEVGNNTGNNANANNNPNNHSNRNKKNKRKFDIEKRKDERLCPTTSINTICAYGDNCRYNHDVEGYLATKLPDISDYCPNFHTFGYCPYGLMCRFGDIHIDRKEFKNRIHGTKGEQELLLQSKTIVGATPEVNTNMDVDKNVENSVLSVADNKPNNMKNVNRHIINSLPRDVQNLLRKKRYVFKNNKDSVSVTSPAPVKQNMDLDTKPQPLTGTVEENNSLSTTTSTTINPIVPSANPIKEEVTNDVASYSNNIVITSANEPVKLIDFSSAKVYVAPLTTVGNLPFRRILKEYGADITCGEMAVASNLEQGQSSEWALLRRHICEDKFGIQLASSHCDQMKRVCKVLEQETSSDFVDLNCGCPIDCLCDRGCGAALMNKPSRIIELLSSSMIKHLTSRATTVKLRIGWDDKNPNIHKIVPMIQDISVGRLSAIFIHGRSRLQRYSKLANWDLVQHAAVVHHKAWMTKQSTNSDGVVYPLVPIIGNGDIMSWDDWNSHQYLMKNCIGSKLAPDGVHSGDDRSPSIVCTTAHNMEKEDTESALSELNNGLLTSCAMIGRGALIKPWLPQEIKQQQDIDISSSERIDIMRRFVHYGLEYWGSDAQGVETTRRFLLEWCSFLHRYVPSGIRTRSQKMNQRPPIYMGRNDVETLLASSCSTDWIKISEMFLGKVADDFHFEPKHKSNSYASIALSNTHGINSSEVCPSLAPPNVSGMNEASNCNMDDFVAQG